MPVLPIEHEQNYRLQIISEIENKLIGEMDTRKALYKKYNRGINITDGVDTMLISTSVIMADVGLTMLIILPLEIASSVCGCMSVYVNLVRRQLSPKAQKHYEIKTLAATRLSSIKNLISKAPQDGQISEQEFKLI